MLRTIAQLTERFAGDEQKIVAHYEEVVARPLTEDERETISNFVNGYLM